MSNLGINYESLKKGFANKSYTIWVERSMIDIIMRNNLMDSNRRRAYVFYEWISVILMVAVIPLIFINWVFSLSAFIGMFVISIANKKSATQFIIARIMESFELYEGVLNKKAIIVRKDGHILRYSNGLLYEK